MECKKCGYKNEETANYCKSCGKNLKEIEQSIFQPTTKPISKAWIIVGLIVLVGALFILREGGKLLTKDIVVTYQNFEFKVPPHYKTTIKKDIFYIAIPTTKEQTTIGIQVHEGTVNEMLKKFQLLEKYRQEFKNVQTTEYHNHNFITIEYEEKNYKTILAITKATNGKIFWVQAAATSYEEAYKAIEEISKVVTAATYAKQISDNNTKENSV